VCIVVGAGVVVATWGENYVALPVGVLGGFAFWWVAVFGPPQCLDGRHE
jgi:hypothetical protein